MTTGFLSTKLTTFDHQFGHYSQTPVMLIDRFSKRTWQFEVVFFYVSSSKRCKIPYFLEGSFKSTFFSSEDLSWSSNIKPSEV